MKNDHRRHLWIFRIILCGFEELFLVLSYRVIFVLYYVVSVII
jgi:hypothetical protein